jgi:SSS family solute:Na+ symporter
MSITAFILFLFGLQAICLIVGAISARGLKTQGDYFLAGKGVSFFPLMMTFVATQVGGGLVLGSAEEAYHFGWSVLFYPIGASLGLLLLGVGLGRKLAQFQVSTIAQIFEVVYKSPVLKKIASLLSIASLFMILAAQIIASNKFMVSLGVESPILFVAFWAIVILYTALGGLKAVIATDYIQAGFFIAAFLLCFGYVAYTADFSAPQLLQAGLPSEHAAFDTSKLYGWLFMPMLFMIIEQDMGQRCFAAKSPKVASQATLWAGICTLLICLIPVALGILATSMDIAIPTGSSVLMAVVKATTTPVLTALVGCAILAAIISTADSLINAIGSNLSQDFTLPAIKGNSTHTSRLLSVGIAVAAIFFSFFFNNIVDLLIQSYAVSVSCLFIPIFIAFFKKNGRFLSATLSICFGAAGYVLFQFIQIPLPAEIAGVLLSLAGYGIGELLPQRTQAQTSST